jgi:uncharacterized repeat protein (TIGR01451 family)
VSAALIVLAGLLVPSGDHGARTALASPASPRTVVIRPRQTNVSDPWSVASLFWFGRATTSNNYVDVRLDYDSQALYVFATIVDYYLWYDPTGASDPRGYDAFALYLDTRGDRASTPASDDYFVVSGFHFYPSGNDPRWHRQGEGTGSGWNEGWIPSPGWTDAPVSRFNQSGPNNNSDLDAGWATTITIPWATLGLSGPPRAGTVWGIGALLYDRDDQPPNGAVAAESWPEQFSSTDPSTWAALVFDPPPYQPPTATNQTTTVIRRGLNGTVTDAYVGGGGDCSGGIFGGGDQPHPTADLFVQNEADVSDFPCFSRSYLQFDLSAIPPGKVITAATLLVYQFGGSDPSQARPSWIQVFSVTDPWDETTLTWNNAPLASKNFVGTWVNPITTFPGWPGVAVTWDVTPLVAEAYAAGRPASLVLYSADTAYHSGKYFVSSDAGDWDAAGRPTLTVVWGDPGLTLTGAVTPTTAAQGDIVTYAFTITGPGTALQFSDPLPSGLEYVAGSATAGATYDAASRTIRWSGSPPSGQAVTITFRAQVSTSSPLAVANQATITDGRTSASASPSLLINGYRFEIFLPTILR